VCTTAQLASSYPNVSVFLVSDKLASLQLGTYLPPGTLSSPLALPGARSPLHVDFLATAAASSQVDNSTHARDVTQQVFSVFAEFVALSACDVVIHPMSGFSMFAAQWGMVPTANIRMLPRLFNVVAEPWTSCGARSVVPDYYKMLRMGWNDSAQSWYEL
jgi:hypothetical protein